MLHDARNFCALAIAERVNVHFDRITEIRVDQNGLLARNAQFAIKDEQIYVLEVNPRASRTVPFVAKATALPIAQYAARIMAGEPLDNFDLNPKIVGRYAVKESVFPFDRFPGVDVVLGPEMRSTGEVMGHDTSFGRAFLKAQQAVGAKLPLSGTLFISVRDHDKPRAVALAGELQAMGYDIIATAGTAEALTQAGIACQKVSKVHEERPHIVDKLKSRAVDLMINTTEGVETIRQSKDIRATALKAKVPYYTTIAGAEALVGALRALREVQQSYNALQNLAS